jgi:hypothetical protein
MSDATNLTGEQLAALRDQARRSGSSFIDPVAFRRVQQGGFYDEWASAVLGRPYPGWNRVEYWEIELLALALDAEPERPVPAAVRERQEAYRREEEEAARRRAQEQAAELATWHALRDSLPVPVTVGHNFTMIHTGAYELGRDHIVTQADLKVGRLFRPARNALCEPVNSAASKRVASYNRTSRDPLRGLERSDDGKDRIPTCKACLKAAHRIAQ